MMWPEQATAQTLELRQVIAGGVDIWDFDYPSYYKGEDKKAFEQKVIDHFFLRQIGAETVGRFLHYFRRTVREIMPLYIQRYESVDLMKDPEIRPLDNYNMIEEYDQNGTNSSSTETTSTGSTSSDITSTGSSSGSSSRDVENRKKDSAVHSDTPQGELMLTLQAEGVAETIKTASDITQNVTADNTGETSEASEETEQTSKQTGTHSGTETGSQSGSTKDHHKLTRRGNIGVTTYAQLLEGYRQTFLNIDMEIINELEPCFLGVF